MPVRSNVSSAETLVAISPKLNRILMVFAGNLGTSGAGFWFVRPPKPGEFLDFSLA